MNKNLTTTILWLCLACLVLIARTGDVQRMALQFERAEDIVVLTQNPMPICTHASEIRYLFQSMNPEVDCELSQKVIDFAEDAISYFMKVYDDYATDIDTGDRSYRQEIGEQTLKLSEKGEELYSNSTLKEKCLILDAQALGIVTFSGFRLTDDDKIQQQMARLQMLAEGINAVFYQKNNCSFREFQNKINTQVTDYLGCGYKLSDAFNPWLLFTLPLKLKTRR